MRKPTLRDQLRVGLACLGPVKVVKESEREVVLDLEHERLAGRYYLGRSGGLRKGRTKGESISLTDGRLYKHLLSLADAKRNA